MASYNSNQTILWRAGNFSLVRWFKHDLAIHRNDRVILSTIGLRVRFRQLNRVLSR